MINVNLQRVESKILFVDIRKNSTGTYLKLSERHDEKKTTLLIPISGISALRDVLGEALATTSTSKRKEK